MARDDEQRRVTHDTERQSSGGHGHGRGSGRSTSRSRGQRDERAHLERSASSGSGHTAKSNPSRTSSNGRANRRRSSHGARKNQSKRRHDTWIYLLPEEIFVQSLLPFLVWHETSALACVNKLYDRLVFHAKDKHAQWTATSYSGNSARECLDAMTGELGRGGTGALRFAPTFAMATVAFTNALDARHTQSVWSELVDTVVAANVLPVGCLLVGMLDGVVSGPVVDGEDVATSAVVLTISVGSLAQTVVDTAAFDRKALRWSASGLTEELACPFGETQRPSDYEDTTSLLVWSTSAKPGQVLLSLATQWFPGAAVAGGVVTRADHAPSLMTFTRAARSAPQRSKKVPLQRKMKAATHAPRGVLSFPSSLLVRFHGKTRVRPLDLCLDRPLTRILKNEAITAVDDVEFVGHDVRSYAVSIVDETVIGESSTHSLWDAVGQFARNERADAVVGSINLLSSTSVDVLRNTLGQHPRPPIRQDGVADSIRSRTLYVDRLGLLTLSDHWDVGQFGIVTVRQNGEDLVSTIERQVKERLVAAHVATERPMASVVLCSNDVEGSPAHISRALLRSLRGIPGHHVFVDGEIGPIGIPHAIGVSPIQLHRRTVSGFMFTDSA